MSQYFFSAETQIFEFKYYCEQVKLYGCFNSRTEQDIERKTESTSIHATNRTVLSHTT